MIRIIDQSDVIFCVNHILCLVVIINCKSYILCLVFKSYIRALIAVKLNNYIAILALSKHKKCSTSMYVKLKIFSFKLPYEATFGFIRKVKLKL